MLDMPVSVVGVFNAKKRVFELKRVFFEGRVYEVEKMGLHHMIRKGREVIHVFSIVAGGMFFRLEMSSESLNFRLKEVTDGMAE